ncbi:MAG: hypothetical protein ABI629_19310 [bacterium]
MSLVALVGLGLASTSARGLTVELNLLYVHGVQNCTAGRDNAHTALADLSNAVDAGLTSRLAAFEAAHPGVHVVVHSGLANLYTATPSGLHPSDSTDPRNMDDWEVGDPGCSTTRQGDPCTAAYEWRYRLAQEINRLFPDPASPVILIGHSTGARTAMEVAANVGPSGAVNTYDWGVQGRIAGVMTVHGMLDAIGTSKYNFVGVTSFETGCKNGDPIAGFGDSCAPGNGWCEYAARVDGFPAADWVAQHRSALMLNAWASCSPSAWTGWSDGSLPFDAQGSPLAVGLDMTPAPDQTYRPSHGQFYGAFCHSAITNSGNSQHAAARDAAKQRLLDWLFVAAPRVVNSGSNTTASIAFNQFSPTFAMGSACASGLHDDALTAGNVATGIDLAGVCKHPGFFDGDDHAIALSEFSVTNGATCNGSYRWQQAHDSSNAHAATFWWKTRGLADAAPDLVGQVVSEALARCGNGSLDSGEACDDGNVVAGDCCSPTCEFEAAGSDCPSDGNGCTTDICSAGGVCLHTANTATCDDGLFCNGGDMCSGGACAAHSGDPCAAGGECNRTCNEATDSCAAPSGSACSSDGNACTDDRCNGAGACAHPPNQLPCSDGLFCNGADTCSGGSCALHAGDPCAAGGECNRACNETADTCAAPAGTSCSSDGNVCTDDRCNGSGACAHPVNTAPCDDGLFCNGADVCAGGSCATHAGDPCAAGPECNRSCGEAARSCAAPAGTACGSDANLCIDDRCDGGGSCGHAANSAACDDGDPCTVGDLCSGGSCQSGRPPDCGLCGSCDAQLGCVQRPRLNCTHDASGQAKLQIHDVSGADRDSIAWTWRKGDATPMEDFGDPEFLDGYTLCIFDESSSTPQRLFAATVPAHSLCGGQPCWRRSTRTLRYRNADRTPDGIDSIKLGAGSAGRAKIQVKGKGPHLSGRPSALPAPPLAAPLRVQLQSQSGACWESTHSQSSVNRATLYKSKSD